VRGSWGALRYAVKKADACSGRMMPTYNVRCLLDTQRSGEGMRKGEAGESETRASVLGGGWWHDFVSAGFEGKGRFWV
jgi:hypothetical protein